MSSNAIKYIGLKGLRYTWSRGRDIVLNYSRLRNRVSDSLNTDVVLQGIRSDRLMSFFLLMPIIGSGGFVDRCNIALFGFTL